MGGSNIIEILNVKEAAETDGLWPNIVSLNLFIKFVQSRVHLPEQTNEKLKTQRAIKLKNGIGWRSYLWV